MDTNPKENNSAQQESSQKENEKQSLLSKIIFPRARLYALLGVFVLAAVAAGIINVRDNSKTPALSVTGKQTYSYDISLKTPRPSKVSIGIEKNPIVEKPDTFDIFFKSQSYGAPDAIRKGLQKNTQELNSLITIVPEIRGEWKSAGGNMLSFAPEKEWLPSQKYEVKLSPKILADNAVLNKNSASFTTFPNAAIIDELFVGPDYKKRQLTLSAKVIFDYPIETAAAEKGVSLQIDKKAVKPKITFDQYNRVMFVSYAPVSLTSKSQPVELKVKFDKLSAQKNMQINSSQDFFSIQNVEVLPPADIGENYILTVKFTDLINAENLLANSMLKVFLLPYDNGKDWNDAGIAAAKAAIKDARELKLKAESAESTISTFQILDDMETADNARYLYVLFDAGMESAGGLVSDKQKAFVVQSVALSKRLKIVGSGSILALKSDHVLNFVSQGIKQADIKLSKINRSSLNHLITQTSGDISNPEFGISRSSYYDNNYSEEYIYTPSDKFNKDNISEIFTKNIALSDTGLKPNFFTLNLNEYFKAGEAGVFLLEASNYSAGIMQRRLISISDIGLIYKKENDSVLKVFALGLAAQKPLSGAKAELIARNGTVLKTEYTNETGMAEFMVPSYNSYDYSKTPVAFVVSKGEDYAFIPIGKGEREVSFSRYDVAGAGYKNYEKGSLSAFVFTDRGIYRPGDTVNFAFIAKNSNWSSTAGLPVQVSVKDPRDKTVFEKTVLLTAEGLLDFNLQTEAAFATGEYKISVYEENSTYISGETFRVEEFKEDKLKINTVIEGAGAVRKGWQPMEGLTGKVTVKNMFGTPATGNTVDIKLQLRPAKFQFSQYADYSFSDVVGAKANLKFIEEEYKGEKTSEKGEVIKKLDLHSYERGAYTISLMAEAFEQESGHSVTAMSTRLISPNKYLIGYKTDADLSYMPHNARQTIDFIAIDPDLNQIDPGELKIKILSKQYISVPVRNNNSYRYQSVIKETLFSQEGFNIKKDGSSSYTLPTKTPGMYAMEMIDKNNETVMRIEFFVSGNANVSSDLERNVELRLNLEKDTVNQGDILNFNVTAPFTGTGLITIEKDKVYAYKWFKTTTNSSTQSIKIPDELKGGAYVNVSFLRSMDSKEILANPYSYAVAYFNIAPTKYTSKITLGVPELVKPGERLNILYSAPASSKIIIYGVNEGILQVAKYKTPNPISYFFRKQNLAVSTYQMWDLIMPDNRVLKEVYGIGGDYEAAQALLEAGLNPFARKTEKPVVFWSGVLDASPTDKTYSYEVPDYFNGQIRVMAVAATQNTASSADKEVLVRAPLMLSAGAPVAAAPGDTFEASVRVSNNKEDTKNHNVTVTAKVSDNLKIIGSSTQNIDVPYGQEKTVSFKMQVLDILGNAEIYFDAQLAQTQISANRKITLSVRPGSAYRVTINNGKGQGSFKIADFEKRVLYPHFLHNTISLSASPLVVADGLGAYLAKFPHGCTEQITSQIFPTILFYKASGNEDGAKDAFARVQEKLRARQLSDGGFSLWDGGYVDKYASLYAFHMLTEADEMGYNVSKEMKNEALEWVKSVASHSSHNNTDYTAYAHYLAAKNGIVMTNELYNLEEYLNSTNPDWKNSLTGVYIAAAYKLLKNEEKALNIIKEYKVGISYRYYNDYDSSFSRNAKYLYIVGLYFPELMHDANAQIIVNSLLEDVKAKRYNTMTSAATMLALYAYSKQSTFKDGDLEVYADGKVLTFTKNSMGMSEASFASDAKEFEIRAKDPSATVYYVITRQGYDKEEVTPKSDEMRISKTYQPDDAAMGNALRTSRSGSAASLSKGTLGEEILVKIEAKALNKDITNAVITDILPGGFTIVPGSVSSSYSGTTNYYYDGEEKKSVPSQGMDYYDVREDRLLIYGTVGTKAVTYTYKVKLTAVGTFKVPAVTGAALYDTSVSAAGSESSFVVENRN